MTNPRNNPAVEDKDTLHEPMALEDLASIIGQEISTAIGHDQDDITGHQARAMDYYFGRRPLKPADPALSGTTANDVSDTIDAQLAQIMPTFTGKSVAKFEALSNDDEQQADIESAYCNYIVMQRCNGYIKIMEAVKNALLLKNCLAVVDVDEKIDIQSRIVDADTVDERALEYLQIQAQQQGNEIEIRDLGDGQMEIRQLIVKRRLVIDTLQNEDFVISSDQTSQNVADDCHFCAYKRTFTVAELLERGIPPEVLNTLQTADQDTRVNDLSRNQSSLEDEHHWYEWTTRPVKVWIAFIRVDYDRDGIPELRRVMKCDSTILENDEIDWIPIASGLPYINPGRWLGISSADKSMEFQDQSTEVLRQYIDNMRYMNDRTLEVEEKTVQMNTVQNRAPGKPIISKRIGAVREIPISDIGPSCITLMNDIRKRRTESTGASLELQSVGQTTGQQTFAGIDRQMSTREQMASMITETLAQTFIKSLYLLVHRSLKAYMPGAQEAKVGQDWLRVDPGQWPDREHVAVNVGRSPGERMRQASTLDKILSIQVQAMSQGYEGQLADAGTIYNTVSDMCRLFDLNPDDYFIDPDSQRAQAAGQRKAQQAQQQQAQQQAMMQQMMDIERGKIMQDMRKLMSEHELKVAQMLLDSEIEQAKLTGQTDEIDKEQDVIRLQEAGRPATGL